MKSINVPAAFRRVMEITAAAGGYLGLAQISAFSITWPFEVSLLWLPAGFAVAACLILGSRAAAGIFAGALLNNLGYGSGVLVSAGAAFGSALQPVLISWMLKGLLLMGKQGRSGQGVWSHNSIQSSARFYAAVLVGTCTAPTIGALTLCASGDALWTSFSSIWSGWWFGDAMGIAALTPVAFHAWSRLLGQRGMGNWIQPLGMSLIALGPLAATIHYALEEGASVRIPGGVTAETLQLATGLLVAVSLAVLGALTIRFVGIVERNKVATESMRLASVHAGVSMWEWNITNGEVSWGPEYYQLLGYANDAFPASYESWASRVHPDDLPGAENFLKQRVFEERTDYADLEFRMRTGASEWRWFAASGKFVERSADGSPSRLVGVLVDIDSRKRDQFELEKSRQALRVEEQRLRSVIDASPALIYRCNYGGDWNVTFISAKVTGLFGYEVDECMRAGWWVGTIHPDDRGYVLSGLSRLLIDDQHMHEYRMRTRTGEWRRVRDELVVTRSESGEPVDVIGAMLDVTEQRRLEEQLRESQKLEAIGQLTGGLAHDFNNLLGVVVGNLDLMSEALPPDEKLRSQHRTALAAALRGAEVTRSLLAIARRQPLQLEIHDLNALISEILPLIRSSAGSAVTVSSQLWAGALPSLLDPAGISNALLNLVINARDAMQEQQGERRLVLRTIREKVDAGGGLRLAPGEYAVLQVADNGPGMTPAVRERAFEPFFTTKEPGRGTGLGLAMVRGIAEQLGGTASIESKAGRGTVVQLYLPLDSTQLTELDEAERERLDALSATGVLDTPPEPEFDTLVAEAARICNTPIALVSLVDERRQWFKAALGIDARETPRIESFCAHAIRQPASVLVVPNTLADPRFSANALVTGEPFIRFYAGVPVTDAAGHALGTLCVIDRRPRNLSKEQLSRLRELAIRAAGLLHARSPGNTAPKPAENSGNAVNVLVVDDELALCELACTCLDSLGYRTTGVHSGAEALAAMENGKFDVLFTDVVMPGGMDGLALANEARRLQPEIRVLFASGYARGITDQAQLPGALLNKPYRKRDLQRAMNQLLSETGQIRKND